MTRTVAVSMWTLVFLLIVIVLVFAGIRVGTDGPLVVSGTAAERDSFEFRYSIAGSVGCSSPSAW